MMISPDIFFELQLKDKSAEEIKTIFRGLKREINRLKNILEHPNYTHTIDPAEDVQLACKREYLKGAINALESLGETYKPTVNELKSIDFNNSIPDISRIEFHIGGYFGPNKHVSIAIDDMVHFHISEMEDQVYVIREREFDCKKEDLLAFLPDLFIGEWRRHYSLERYGVCVDDGTQWELIIEYNNDRKSFKSTGDNAYPYNFQRFLDIICLDDQLYV